MPCCMSSIASMPSVVSVEEEARASAADSPVECLLEECLVAVASAVVVLVAAVASAVAVLVAAVAVLVVASEADARAVASEAR